MPTDDPEDQPEQAYVEQQGTEWADPDLPNTVPSGETLRADRRDAQAAHDPDRPPTDAEEAAAPDERPDPDVARAYREATDRGVEQEGEGRI